MVREDSDLNDAGHVVAKLQVIVLEGLQKVMGYVNYTYKYHYFSRSIPILHEYFQKINKIIRAPGPKYSCKDFVSNV